MCVWVLMVIILILMFSHYFGVFRWHLMWNCMWQNIIYSACFQSFKINNKRDRLLRNLQLYKNLIGLNLKNECDKVICKHFVFLRQTLEHGNRLSSNPEQNSQIWSKKFYSKVWWIRFFSRQFFETVFQVNYSVWV